MTERMTFINLPVADVAASRRYFEGLGFSFDDKFSDQSAGCMQISSLSYAMLIDRERFAGFSGRPVADPTQATGALVCITAEDRAGVDAFADAALAAGGTKALDPTDYGFMYGRSFYDLDGHHWEVMWMDPQAVEQGPEAFAASQG